MSDTWSRPAGAAISGMLVTKANLRAAPDTLAGQLSFRPQAAAIIGFIAPSRIRDTEAKPGSDRFAALMAGIDSHGPCARMRRSARDGWGAGRTNAARALERGR